MLKTKIGRYLLWGICILLMFTLSGAWYLYSLLKPINPSSMVLQKFVVPKGSGAAQIGHKLKEEGLIRSPLIFRIVVKVYAMETELQAGTFDLSTGMDVTTIATELTKGTEDVWVTIQEGWRIEEIADSLLSQGLTDFDREEFLQLTRGTEGRYFPDTYLVPRTMTAQSMYDLLTSTFERKVLQGLAAEISQYGGSFDEMLVIASLLEREAQNFEDMRLVAGVIQNRLAIGMPLQIDATLQYAKGYSSQENTWWATPLAVDKDLDSPFNTYLNTGIPPQPIANPGITAIQAALNPLESDYFFYIHDSSGEMYAARTLEEHNRNVNTYLR